jgi:hypothetical protein
LLQRPSPGFHRSLPSPPTHNPAFHKPPIPPQPSATPLHSDGSQTTPPATPNPAAQKIPIVLRLILRPVEAPIKRLRSKIRRSDRWKPIKSIPDDLRRKPRKVEVNQPMPLRLVPRRKVLIDKWIARRRTAFIENQREHPFAPVRWRS